MTTRQQFCLKEFKWSYFPINKSSYTAVISLQIELAELFLKYLIELMPEYPVIVIDSRKKFEELQKFQQRKVYVFNFTMLPETDSVYPVTGIFPFWEDIDRLDEIKFKIFLYNENTKKIPGALLTRADLILMGELKDYMSMFFNGISFSVDREVICYLIDKTEMTPSYYFFDSRLMNRTFRLNVVKEEIKEY
jgi:hypothetical protein